jgi:hypothetical protein
MMMGWAHVSVVDHIMMMGWAHVSVDDGMGSGIWCGSHHDGLNLISCHDDEGAHETLVDHIIDRMKLVPYRPLGLSSRDPESL